MAATDEQGSTQIPAPPQGGGVVMFGADIEIFSDRPCDGFSSFGAHAFDARDKRAAGERFALLCSPQNLPRITSVPSYKNFKNPHMLNLSEAGIVEWTPDARQYLAMIFEKPHGHKMQASPQDAPYRLPEERLLPGFLTPLLSALGDYNNADLVHGGINLGNLFVAGTKGAESVILGECVSSPPGMRQPAIYETIERAMANPAGRGRGTNAEDLYAVGVSLVLAMRGEDPFKDMDDRTIIQAKIDKGSYTALVGADKVPASISEFLRGVLSDDPDQRWDVREALRWLDGRRHASKQSRGLMRASRHYNFEEQKVTDLRTAAMLFSDKPAEALAAMEKDQFDLWVKRNFENTALDDDLVKTREREKSSGQDRMMSALSIILDPLAPVRYKNLSMFPDALGVMLAYQIAREQDMLPLTEAVQHQILNQWVNQRYDELPDAASILLSLEKCKTYLQQKVPGYGIERALYTLDNEAACMSPYFKRFCVFSVGALLPALERVAQLGNRPDNVLDRHMIAFISVREAKMIDPHLGHIISHNRAFQVIGVLRTLAGMQQKFPVGSLPNIGNWIISLMKPVIERYNDKDLRDTLEKNVEKLKNSGDLAKILDLVDNEKQIQEDIARYAAARREFALLAREMIATSDAIKKNKKLGLDTGRQVAMMVSSLLSCIAIMLYIIAFFAGGGI